MNDKSSNVIDADYVVIGDEAIPLGLATPNASNLPANRRHGLKEQLQGVPSVSDLPVYQDGQGSRTQEAKRP